MYDILFLIGLSVIGLSSSYTDIKYGKIKNKHLMVGIAYALAVNLFLVLTAKDVSLNAYTHYITNFISSLIIGFVFWKIGIWTAGDGKLYSVMNLLSPPSSIEYGYLGPMYGITFLTNSFIVLTVIFAYRIFTRVSMDEFKESLKSTFSKEMILTIPLFAFGMHVISLFRPGWIPSNIVVDALLFYFILTVIYYFFKTHIKLLIGALAVFRLLIDFESALTIDYWIEFILITINMFIFMFLLVKLSYFALTTEKNINELEEKMHLAEDIVPAMFIEENKERKEEEEKKLVNSKNRYTKMRLIKHTLIQYFFNEQFKLPHYKTKKGLSRINIKWIEKNKDRLLFSRIRVFDTMPFAPILFLGFLTTTIIKSDVIIFILRMI